MGSELRPRRSRAVALSRPVVAGIVYMIHAFQMILICFVTSSLEFLGDLLRGFCPYSLTSVTAGVSHIFLEHVFGSSV